MGSERIPAADSEVTFTDSFGFGGSAAASLAVKRTGDDMAMPALELGKHRARRPIVQGGMGVGISLSGLASAVANAGGIGVISTVGIGMHEADVRKKPRQANRRALRAQIQRARSLTDGVIGLNIMVALMDYDKHVEVGLDEGVDILFLGAGLPLKFSPEVPPERLRETTTAFVPIVSSPRAVQLIFSQWAKRFGRVPDGVVVEGPKAGGHLGFKKEQIDDPAWALEEIVPQVIETVRPFEDRFGRRLPVIAAGGVYTGSDIDRFLSMGAGGVQLGTRFVATHECDAHLNFKKAFVAARREDLVIINSPVGLPGRAIRNSFLDDVESGAKHPIRCSWKCLRTCEYKEAPYCIADALISAKDGELEHGFSFAGANAWRVNDIISVAELMQSLEDEYVVATSVPQELASVFRSPYRSARIA